MKRPRANGGANRDQITTDLLFAVNELQRVPPVGAFYRKLVPPPPIRNWFRVAAIPLTGIMDISVQAWVTKKRLPHLFRVNALARLTADLYNGDKLERHLSRWLERAMDLARRKEWNDEELAQMLGNGSPIVAGEQVQLQQTLVNQAIARVQLEVLERALGLHPDTLHTAAVFEELDAFYRGFLFPPEPGEPHLLHKVLDIASCLPPEERRRHITPVLEATALWVEEKTNTLIDDRYIELYDIFLDAQVRLAETYDPGSLEWDELMKEAVDCFVRKIGWQTGTAFLMEDPTNAADVPTPMAASTTRRLVSDLLSQARATQNAADKTAYTRLAGLAALSGAASAPDALVSVADRGTMPDRERAIVLLAGLAGIVSRAYADKAEFSTRLLPTFNGIANQIGLVGGVFARNPRALLHHILERTDLPGVPPPARSAIRTGFSDLIHTVHSWEDPEVLPTTLLIQRLVVNPDIAADVADGSIAGLLDLPRRNSATDFIRLQFVMRARAIAMGLARTAASEGRDLLLSDDVARGVIEVAAIPLPDAVFTSLPDSDVTNTLRVHSSLSMFVSIFSGLGNLSTQKVKPLGVVEYIFSRRPRPLVLRPVVSPEVLTEAMEAFIARTTPGEEDALKNVVEAAELNRQENNAGVLSAGALAAVRRNDMKSARKLARRPGVVDRIVAARQEVINPHQVSPAEAATVILSPWNIDDRQTLDRLASLAPVERRASIIGPGDDEGDTGAQPAERPGPTVSPAAPAATQPSVDEAVTRTTDTTKSGDERTRDEDSGRQPGDGQPEDTVRSLRQAVTTPPDAAPVDTEVREPAHAQPPPPSPPTVRRDTTRVPPESGQRRRRSHSPRRHGHDQVRDGARTLPGRLGRRAPEPPASAATRETSGAGSSPPGRVQRRSRPRDDHARDHQEPRRARGSRVRGGVDAPAGKLDDPAGSPSASERADSGTAGEQVHQDAGAGEQPPAARPPAAPDGLGREGLRAPMRETGT